MPNLFKPRENDTVIGSVFANAMTAFREAYVLPSDLVTESQ